MCVFIAACVDMCATKEMRQEQMIERNTHSKGCQAFFTSTNSFFLVCVCMQCGRHAQTHERESEAKTHTPKDVPSGAECAHTNTESLVGNEGFKSESIMNVPSGGCGAIPREPGIRQ